MNILEKKEKRRNIILNTVLLLLLFIPHVGVLYLVPPLLLVFVLAYDKIKLRPSVVAILITTFVILSFLVNTIDNAIVFKNIILGFLIVSSFSFFPLVKSFKIYHWTILVAVCYVLISQICYILDLSFFIRLYEALYPMEDEAHTNYLRNIVGNTDIGGYYVRFGGLFHNANQCSRCYSFLFAITCIEANSIFRDRWALVSVLMITLGAVISGSRTGMFAIIAIFIFYLIFSGSSKDKIPRYLLLPIMILIIYWIYTQTNVSSMRVFAIDQGMEDSLGVKIQNLLYYLENDANIYRYIFGVFYPIDNYLNMDSDIGNSIYIYGFPFLILIIIFFIKIYGKLHKKNRLMILPLVWCISATIIFNYRFLLVYIFLLSLYYERSKENKCLINNK